MVTKRTCRGITKGGERCSAWPLHNSDFCFMHDPDHLEEAAEARRIGGQRRKRESTLLGAYEISGVGSVADLMRLLEVVMFDALSLENSVARGRLLLGVIRPARSSWRSASMKNASPPSKPPLGRGQ